MTQGMNRGGQVRSAGGRLREDFLEVAVSEQKAEELSLSGWDFRMEPISASPAHAGQSHLLTCTQLLCLEAYGVYSQHLPSNGKCGQV